MFQLPEPYFSALLRDGTNNIRFSAIDPPADPKQKFFLTLDISTTHFLRHAAFQYGTWKGCENPKLWWEDGMQMDVVHQVHIVADCLDDGIFVLYCMMNSVAHPVLLGRLLDDHAFTKRCFEKLRGLLCMHPRPEKKPKLASR